MPLLFSRPRAAVLTLVLLVLAGLVAALLPSLPARAAGPAYLSGPDVSHWQHADDGTGSNFPITWPSVKSPGNQTFAISKATEDVTFTDPYFAPDYAAEKAQGLHPGQLSLRPAAAAVLHGRGPGRLLRRDHRQCAGGW